MRGDPMTEPGEDIAIVGVGGYFAASDSPDALWSIVRDAIDATGEVPGGRWLIDPVEALDRRIAVADHVYTARGGFVDGLRFDPSGTGLDRGLLDRLDPVFHLALAAAGQAWRDARTDRVDRGRTGVVFGNIVLPTETASALSREVLGGAFESKLGLPPSPSGAFEPLNAFPAGLPAAVVASALGLGGAAYTLDAACGSSLYALKLAVDELRSGRADAMIGGGVSRPDALYTQMGFSQLRALSPRGRAAPLDHRGDGLIVGEGAGMFVLKRLADALSDGDHIYGIVAGIGLSNDIHGDLLAPDSEGQLRAMRAAYEQAGWRPGDVDLIECHATGTPRGDAVEVQSLKSLWGEAGWEPGQCVIGSIKGNIGHALTAAGAAGLLKVLMALKHGELPPTANFERPAPALGLEGSPFRVLTRPEPWPSRAPDRPRRAAISGFGFGGINAHVLIEEWTGRPLVGRGAGSGEPRPAHMAGSLREVPIAIVGMSAQVGAMQGEEAFRGLVLGGDPKRKGDESSPDHRLESLEFRVDQFRIPPRELSEMLPQQSLMLRVAAESMRDAGWDPKLALRTGVLIGIGLDLNTTNYHLRWSMAGRAREWNRTLRLGLSREDLARWAEELREAAGPALSANRTMGSLGGLVASRIAREFRVGGPSFTVACDETSGIQALAIAVEWLRRGELDAAIVGAVDLAGDPRAELARRRLRGESSEATDGRTAGASDAAVSLVLKRLDEAERDGDRVYAVIRGCAATTRAFGQVPNPPAVAAPMAMMDRRCAGNCLTDHDDRDVVPVLTEYPTRSLGAAAGLVSTARAAFSLYHQILPPDGSRAPQFWLRNRAEGPRRAEVNASSLGGNRLQIHLEESPVPEVPSTEASPARSQPIGARRTALFAIEADDEAGLSDRIAELAAIGRELRSEPIDSLARRWWRRHPNDPSLRRGLAIVAGDVESLGSRLELARERIVRPVDDRIPTTGGSIHLPRREAARMPSRLAFVYPGLGNYFEGMGRELAALWPDILRRQDAESGHLRDQFLPEVWWDEPLPKSLPDHRVPILGQVSVGSVVTDVLLGLGVIPDAAIGYSMGESAALVALRAWVNRDEMQDRLRSSSLFESDLAGPCHVARQAWGIPPDRPVDWVAGIVPRSADDVRGAIADTGADRVYILIKNTSEETVIGGFRPAVSGVVQALRCAFVELPTVSTVHCEIGRAVEVPYRALHTLETVAPPDITFYSGVWGRPYDVDRRSAAEAITAQATGIIDFPALIERAYADGVGVFVEVGPGSSCTRLIGRILGRRPHLACAAYRSDRDALVSVLEVLGECIANRIPVDLRSLYGTPPDQAIGRDGGEKAADLDRRHTVRVEVGLKPIDVPPLPSPPGPLAVSAVSTMQQEYEPTTSGPPSPAPSRPLPAIVAQAARHRWVGDERSGRPDPRPRSGESSPMARSVHDAELARLEAHRAFLRLAEGASALMGKQLALQLELIDGWKSAGAKTAVAHVEPDPAPVPNPAEAVLYDRRQCLELAVGSVAAVFGPGFAEVDRFPTRVRLPDEPLMLVDRIMTIEGMPRSLKNGRIVTEHEVHPGAWYLDSDRVAPCVAIEAGQADLVLSGYLGVDFETRGLAMYRLLDATVTYHRGLPVVDEVIRYDIRINRFFRQGKTILFQFEYDATVAGEPVLMMRDGCAGFFTQEDLDAGKGIVNGCLALPPKPGPRPGEDHELIPLSPGQLDERQVDALRRGDLASAFGSPFDRLPIEDPIALPGGLMGLIHRVPTLDGTGGASGLGIIRAEADIHPGDWFMVCHFVDDRVMPGTLMYECALQTLRIFMMRLGWLGRKGRVAFEPVAGIANRLKCRGQIVESTRRVTYEVTIKERGYRPEPYCIADVLIYADGKPIVAFDSISLQLTGSDRQELERIWIGVATPAQSDTEPPPRSSSARPVLFTREQLLALSTGNPSEAFGKRYRPFDRERFLARLPRPPFQFIDRVVRSDAEPWVMVPGGTAESEYDVPADAWYFEADRQEQMPFAVLAEVALQTCGWLATYMGSALTSDDELRFRNLGGRACQHRPVTRQTGTLTTRIKVAKIASAAGMILQHFEFAVYSRDGLVYDGTTEFGYFHPASLAQQVGIRDAAPYVIGEEERVRSRSFDVPDEAPFPDPRWRMISRVDDLVLDGGPHGLGVVRGSTRVDSSAWFFEAHFLHDPVWPGSLGLESFMQLLKIVAATRWGAGPGSDFESPSIGQAHQWTYRGQIVPQNGRVTVQAEIKALDDHRRWLMADGYLEVDGRIIYQMNDFAIGLSVGEGR
jgi:acyl transferase domain-containing protein/3-hydroxymyristoyl/3-hydroxydecanoyl-(acyl carrier protein) dehydratase